MTGHDVPGAGYAARPRRISRRAIQNSVWITLLLLLIAGVWVAIVVFTPAPPTLAEVTRPVSTLADELVASIPSASVASSTDDSHVADCALKDGRRQYVLERVVLLKPGFDRSAWMADRYADYSSRDGWVARVFNVGDQSERELKLSNRQLSDMTVTGTDVDGGRLTLRATSACGE